jgi:phosphatidylglycerophosphatase A
MKEKIAVVIATWFYTGLIPPVLLKGMAGTYGSLFSLPLCWLLINFYWREPVVGMWCYFVAFLAVLITGLWSVPIAESTLGAQTDWQGKQRKHDQNQIVIDEVWGMLIACYPIAILHPRRIVLVFLIAFGLFRFFDTVKPWPAGYFDRLNSAFGVMMDDLAAGVWAAIGVAIFISVF